MDLIISQISNPTQEGSNPAIIFDDSDSIQNFTCQMYTFISVFHSLDS